jgi:filamentous hemagglutinin
MGQYNAGFVSGQMLGEAIEVTTLAGSEDLRLGSVVTGQVASSSTQRVGQVSSVQRTTQVAAGQATRVTTGQITGKSTQPSTQAQAPTATAQSLTQQTAQTATELNAEFANTSGLVNVAGSSGKYVGSDVTVGLDTSTGSTLEISAGGNAAVDLSAGASANVGLSDTVSSGQTVQVTTDQVTQQTTEVLTQPSTQTSEIDGITMNTGSRHVTWKSTRGVGQEQTMQTSTELDVETKNKSGLVTVAGSSAHCGGHVSDQTQSSVQQTTQSSTQQTMRTSAELDVKKGSSGTLVAVASSSGQDGGVSVQTQGEEVVGVTIINGSKEVQHELETHLQERESRQGVGQLSSAQQTTPSFSRQVSQASTDTTLSSDTMLSLDSTLSSDTTLSSYTTLSSDTQSSTQQTKEISTELSVRTGNTNDIVTVAGSSEKYNGKASVQTQEETVGIAIVQGGEDVQSVTGQVSTQGVIQSSSVQQTIQSSSKETHVDLEQVSQITSVQF